VADLREQLQSGLDDRYRLERELGRGGMATVYLAHDLKHDRQVALKVLHAELAASLGPERFQREIRTTARLQHPHILPVLDSGEAAGQLWYTMPYVEGESLRDRLRREGGESLRDRLRREGQLPLDDALQIAREVADALGYAHSQGIVHRDIKPENILLSRGHALVADFGIARALQMTDAEHLTATGLAIGTPAYMSPEQAGGASSVDGRSDLYSLGCVLYEMLTGEVPYTGRTPQAVIAKRVLEPLPHVRTLRASVPQAVEQAISRALAVTPADRFTTAAEFAVALTQRLTDPGLTSTPTAPQPTAGRWRRVSRGVATLALGVLLGLGVLLAWLRTRPEPGVAGPKRLAVLPFENLGDSADTYFADGVTDAIRGKLTMVTGLQVIASTSADEYRNSHKSPRQVARELGVTYLLVGKIRWQKSGGESRVEVSPELVDLADPKRPMTRWQQPFDAALTDVFRIQAEIAGQVAHALKVALGDSVESQLAEKPTRNLQAYEAFLRGEATWHDLSHREAIANYERAVALDPAFYQAWAKLARAQALLPARTPAMADASRRAAERALALAPDRPEGHTALAEYYSSVLHDNSRTFTEDSMALALAPGDANCLTDVGNDELVLGRWEEARGHLEQAVRLDPRSPQPAAGLGNLLLLTRHFPEARQVLDRALLLKPASLWLLQHRMILELARGDLDGAQAILRTAPKELDPTVLVAYMAYSLDLMWVLDEAQQQLLLRLTPSAFEDDRANWGLLLAQTYWLRGDRAKARVYADTARLTFERQLRNTPQEVQLHALLGLALAYLGQKTEAIRQGERGVALRPISRDALDGPYRLHQLARIYLLVGEPEKALVHLESLLKIPYYLSPGWLKIDPNFAPLRGNPRFERLLRGT
jgi:serine/threonine-protein kinase